MPQDKETFLGRWSRLKKEQERDLPAKREEKSAQSPGEKGDEAPPLPPVETLTPQSDFTGFMHHKVEDALRRVALKKLFRDPHFSIPDLNEAYSGDWTGGEPITPEMLKQLNQARTLLFTDEEKKALDEQEAKQESNPEPVTEQAAQKQEPIRDEPGRQDT